METNEGGQARKHHYVPQCYLKGFARNRSKKSQLYVVDLTLKRAFVTTPLNVAAERDFNRIDIDGEDPNLIESSYAEFETKLAPALVRMDERGDFPDDADRAVILELVALLAVRNPGRREAMRQFKEETTRRLMELAAANRQRWETQRQKAADAGVESAADLTYEEVREFVERGDYTIDVPTTKHVEQELKSLTTVYNLLHRRNWVVVRAAPASGGFVTSDHPVTLCWDDKDMEGGFYPPGFGLHGTTVFCPVSKGLAIRGRFDGRVGAVELPLDKVAGINSLAIFHAGRQIYAENDRFRFFDKRLMLRYGQDLLSTPLRP